MGPEEFSDIEEDDILVAEMTSSAFNVLLPLLGGIVTDEGRRLHPAIVAREFGIPGVVGYEDATDRTEDGDRIVVDAKEGSVRTDKSAGRLVGFSGDILPAPYRSDFSNPNLCSST